MQTVKERIRQRRLQMLVHSYIYYKLDNNIIDDATWSRWAKELQQLQVNYPEDSKEVEWAEAFEGWDGSSGAFLPLDNEWVKLTAIKILEIHNSTHAQAKPKKQTKPKTNSLSLF